MNVTIGRLVRAVAAGLALAGTLLAVGCGNHDPKADASNNTAQNTRNASSAGVNNGGSPAQVATKPPFDPSK